MIKRRARPSSNRGEQGEDVDNVSGKGRASGTGLTSGNPSKSLSTSVTKLRDNVTNCKTFKSGVYQMYLLMVYGGLVVIGAVIQHVGLLEQTGLWDVLAPLRNKRSFLNVVFVKLGWAWTSLPLFLYILVAPLVPLWERLKALGRLTFYTLYWVYLTQAMIMVMPPFYNQFPFYSVFPAVFTKVYRAMGHCNVDFQKDTDTSTRTYKPIHFVLL